METKRTMGMLEIHPIIQTVYDRKETFITVGNVVIGSARKAEDAAHIVHMSKNFDEMLDTLRGVRAVVTDDAWLDRISAVIMQAEAK